MGAVIKETVLKHGGKVYLAVKSPQGDCLGCSFDGNVEYPCQMLISSNPLCLRNKIFPNSSAIFKCLGDDCEEE